MSTAPAVTKPENGTTLAKPPARQPMIVHDESAVSYLMDTARFEHLFRIARTMANSSLTPKHLKGRDIDETVANCFRVVNQAMRWQFDPFCVADETYVVGGKLGYQGKLVAAVINSRAKLSDRLRPTYAGSGLKREVTIHGTFENETEERTITLTVEQARTENKMWTQDPDQKLFYSGVIKWARRHCPEVIMGVLTEDDLERIQIDTTATVSLPAPTGSKSDQLAERMAANSGAKDENGPSQTDTDSAEGSNVTSETAGEESQTAREPGDESPPAEGVSLSDLALEIEEALNNPALTATMNTSRKQQVVDLLGEGKLKPKEATHLQMIIERNADRFSEARKGK